MAATINAVRAEVRELRKCRIDFLDATYADDEDEEDDEDEDEEELEFLAEANRFHLSPQRARASDRKRDRQVTALDTCASSRVPRQSHGA